MVQNTDLFYIEMEAINSSGCCAGGREGTSSADFR
jgi:hypothetical protein